ncbi:MAG: site-2 protease family protein [Xenococcaceae cyanobacterium]
MELWLLLILLGLITYFIVKRSVATITRTPVWLFWLVMMAPALIWSAWPLLFGEDKPMPIILVIGPFVICPLLYWWLIQLGRPTPEAKGTKNEPRRTNDSETPKASEDSSKPRPITKSEETTLRNCFPWGVYYLQHIDYRPQAILCRGKLRSVPEVAYKTIKENIEKEFGDRFLVVFQESFGGSPFFALVPNPSAKSQNKPQTEPLTQPGLALGLLLITLFTTTVIGAKISVIFSLISSGISPEQLTEQLSESLPSDPTLLIKGLPYSLGIVLIIGVHELSHYLTALYYKIRTTLPYFIPVPFFLGTFGAFIQMRSPFPNRKALFDVAIAGPVGGFVVTLPLLIWGLSLSEVVPLSDTSNLLSFEALDPRFSLLLAVLGKLALGHELMPGEAINLHPVAVAGYVGLIVTALNLMPVGQLDGGHIVHAMFGQRGGAVIGQVTRLLMIVLAITQRDFWLWAIILWLMPIADQPALNDVTELDNLRDLYGLLSLVLLVSILLPLPGAIAQWLNI